MTGTCACGCGSPLVTRGARFVSNHAKRTVCVHGVNGKKNCADCQREYNAAWKRANRSAEYRVWSNINQRCLNPRNKNYYQYGGRGIAVCDRWRGSFENFSADMGHRPSSRHEIDRIDNNRGYEPGNCRWVTRSENARNTRVNHLLTINGITATIAEWAERSGLTFAAIRARVKSGKTGAELLAPVSAAKSRRRDAR